jgi:DNA polymerase-1
MPRLRLLPPVESAETPEEAAPIFNYLMNRGGHIAIDTETTGIQKLESRVLFWSMATEDRRFFLTDNLLGYFRPLLERKDVTWRLANAKFDRHMLANMGYEFQGPTWDIIDMDAMIDDTRPHGLKDQAWLSYQAKWGEFKELFLDPWTVAEELGFDKSFYAQFKQLDVGQKLLEVYNQRPDIVEDYASCDAFFTYMRAEDLATQLAATTLPTEVVPGFKTLSDYYETIEVPLTRSLWRMERAGFAVDRDWVKQIDIPMRDGIAALNKELRQIIGYEFNPKSSADIASILYDKSQFAMKPLKYTSGGGGEPKPSTDEATLKTLKLRCSDIQSPQFKFLDALLRFKKLTKLHGTYVKNIDKVIASDGRVHCRLNQSGARTSRLSSSDPNMQNIPIRNDPYKIRGCFVADPGTLLIDYDYPQIEFRIAAALAGEKDMIEAIKRGWDIHTANAANMYKSDSRVTYDAIMEARRKKDAKEPMSDIDKYLLSRRDGAKTVGLGTLYGEGTAKMAQELKISRQEAEELRDAFFTTYPSIANQIDYMHGYAHTYEHTHTMLGRMRRLHRINNLYNSGLVAAEERQAYNSLIQGSGAEMMKLALLRIDNNPDFIALGGRLVLTVHDELIARAPKDTAHEVAGIMKEMMSDPYNWGPIRLNYPVPVDPDGSIGERWSDVK